jgi:hypothetical protein
MEISSEWMPLGNQLCSISAVFSLSRRWSTTARIAEVDGADCEGSPGVSPVMVHHYRPLFCAVGCSGREEEGVIWEGHFAVGLRGPYYHHKAASQSTISLMAVTPACAVSRDRCDWRNLINIGCRIMAPERSVGLAEWACERSRFVYRASEYFAPRSYFSKGPVRQRDKGPRGCDIIVRDDAHAIWGHFFSRK